MCIKDRIERLRQKMEEHHISVYMIPTADYHQSEYVGEHFKSRAFITGFTGSAGTAVITKEESCLWTDGRYFLQAESQLQEAGSVCRRWENRECLRSQNISNLYWENLKISDLTEEPSGLQKENSTKRSRKRSTDRCTMAVIWLMRSGKRDRLCLKNRHFIWKRPVQENLRHRN